VKVFVILEGQLDKSGEKARLEKEMAKIEKELAQVNRKLENPDFWQKAAQAVIDKEEAKARSLNERFDILQAALKKL
jgi:valyl-tRNA synthetase